jgi:TonB family protein
MASVGPALLLLLLTAQGQVIVSESDDLASARTLYAAGDYEAALSRLASLRAEQTADEVDQYRALCLLALGRTQETERSLETLVARRPLFRMSDGDVSPRLVGMFHTVRKRMLPGVIRDLYAKAKTDFDEKRFAEAASRLKDMLELIGDEDAAGAGAVLADLKTLGQGFLTLANHEVEVAERAARAAEEAAAAALAKAAASREPPAPPPPPRVYTDADTGIVPPVVVNRTLPPWRPANAAIAARSYQGHLRVVVDEQGRVESASLVRPFLEGYDALLVEAARQWQFRPATRDGVAVKYLRLFTIDVSAR